MKENSVVNRMTAREAAKEYLRRSWKTVPIPWKEKRPITRDWQLTEITQANLNEHFPSLSNIGVQFGPVSNGLVDVDCDCDEARALAPVFLPDTGAVFGRRSAPQSHWLYYSDLCETTPRAAICYDDPSDAGLIRAWRASAGAAHWWHRAGPGGEGSGQGRVVHVPTF
jgi:Bifunctional DNA primase/polymerase, N-terminal